MADPWDDIGAPTPGENTPVTQAQPWDNIGAPAPAAQAPAAQAPTPEWDNIGAPARPAPAPAQTNPLKTKTAEDYLRNRPTQKPYDPSQGEFASQQLAKAGTVGTEIDYSDKQRELDALKNQTVSAFNQTLQNYTLDPTFRQLPATEQERVINAQIDQFVQQGLAGGQYNAANPQAFTDPEFRKVMFQYYKDLMEKGALAQSPVGRFIEDPKQKLIVAKAPTLFGNEELGAAGATMLQAMPGALTGNLTGQLGEALGAATRLPGGSMLGGIAGSMLGAYGADKLIQEGVDSEEARNRIQGLADAVAMGEQEHPLASAAGRAAAQLLSTRITNPGQALAQQVAPRLTGGAIGAGIEAGSEAGRGEDLSGAHIAEAAASGMVFSNPRWSGHLPRLNYLGRDWQNTNFKIDEANLRVADMFRNGQSPIEVLQEMGRKLPDTPENRTALRQASGDIRAGRDPSSSLAKIKYRPDGISVQEAQDAWVEHTKDWTNPPEVEFHDSYDSPTIPKERRGEAGPGTLGWKDETGKIHIVASQHADADAVTATMFHEGMHAGLVRAYQNGLEAKLNELYDGANSRFAKALDLKWKEQQKNNPHFDGLSAREKKALVTDEVLANASENGIHSGEFDKMATWIRNFGRSKLPKMKLAYSDAEIRQILSTGHDAVAHGTNTGELSPVRYMNFGIRSRGSDLDSLESYGDSVPVYPEYPEGWFAPTHDNNPRYEVSDKDAQFNLDKIPADDTSHILLPDLINHPRLFQAYPELKNVKVKLETDPNNRGSWHEEEKTLYVRPDIKDSHKTILHEIQHAIQGIEGWPKGANSLATFGTAPLTAIKQAMSERIDTYQKRADNYAKEYHLLNDFLQTGTYWELKAIHEAKQGLDKDTPEYQSLRDRERRLKNDYYEAKGFPGHYDWDISIVFMRALESKTSPEKTLEGLSDDWRESNQRSHALETALQGDEWDIRRTARRDFMLPEMLYYRSGGEYEARATASRSEMTDADRLADPQFLKRDEVGVHPSELYAPREWNPEYAAKTADHLKENPANDEGYPTPRPRTETQTLPHPDGGRRTIPNPDSIDWSKPGDVRFSRKYSDTFPKDYLGREQRTEDLLKSHFGNFAYSHLKGMMRPLEGYQRVTNGEILKAAQELKELGLDPEVAVARGAIPDDSAFMVALKDLVYDKKTEAQEVARRYRASGGMRYERELMMRVTELGEILSLFDKSASNLARTLYSLRLNLQHASSDEAIRAILEKVRFANGKLDATAMDDIAKTLIESNDPTAIRKAIDKFDPKWKDYGKSMFYNYLLGTTSAQFGNVLGNATHIMKAGVQDVLGYGIGKAFNTKDRMHFDELMGRTQGLLAALLNKETYNGHRAYNTAAKEFFLKAGSQQHENKFVSQAIENVPLSVILEHGTRGVQATDAFFRTVIEHSAMQGLATREARRLNGGKTPSQAQIAAVMASPSKKMLSEVAGEADRLLFQEDPAGPAEKFSQMMRSLPGGWLLTPFVRTPANIGRAAFESFDPTGRITQRNRDALAKGGPDANRVRAGQLMAAALWAGVVYMLNNDMIHGGGPTDPVRRAQWAMKNVPYTIGNDETGRIAMRHISPLGDGLAMIADANELYKEGKLKPDAELSDKTLMLAAAASDAVLTNSFASSLTDQIERGMQPGIQNLMGTVVQAAASIPIYSQYKKNTDPFIRDTSKAEGIFPSMGEKASLMDNSALEHYFQGVIPRDELPIRRDPFGAPLKADHPTSTDPVGIEVGRIVESTGKSVVPAFPRVVKGKRAPNDLYNNFLAFSGPIMREAAWQIMKTPEYTKALTDEQRGAVLRKGFENSGIKDRLNKQYQQMMLDRNPTFEQNFIPEDKKILSEIPGE